MVCVSLSGGVDSMVICEALDHLRWFPPNLRLVGTRGDRPGRLRGQRRDRNRLQDKRAKLRRCKGDQQPGKTIPKSVVAEMPAETPQESRDRGLRGLEEELTLPLEAPLFRLVAAHIDYGNRAQSASEAAFLARWCKRRQIPLRLRRIEEAQRGQSDRDEYEKLTRKIRFDTYREIVKEYGGHCQAVIFGHHRGDVQENVLSNFFHGGSLMELR